MGAEGVVSSSLVGLGITVAECALIPVFRVEQRLAVDGSNLWYEDQKLMLKAQRHALAELKSSLTRTASHECLIFSAKPAGNTKRCFSIPANRPTPGRCVASVEI